MDSATCSRKSDDGCPASVCVRNAICQLPHNRLCAGCPSQRYTHEKYLCYHLFAKGVYGRGMYQVERESLFDDRVQELLSQCCSRLGASRVSSTRAPRKGQRFLNQDTRDGCRAQVPSNGSFVTEGWRVGELQLTSSSENTRRGHFRLRSAARVTR